ncbi:MAG: hypothetical protein EBZ24_12605, partial [Synechococcaceae bacterium WB9_4xB_025]|nr:hypothetical protein [Synechococcaceae bacterium WB9_4xB_025]
FEGLEEEPFAAPAQARRCCSTPADFSTALRLGLAMEPNEAERLDAQCREFIERCFSAEAQQQALRTLLPSELRPTAMGEAVAVGSLAWPDGIRGGAEHGLELLASSRGLQHDSWLEQNNLLVLRLPAQRGPGARLGLSLYLPDSGVLEGECSAQITLGDGQRPRAQTRVTLRRGLNEAHLELPAGMDTMMTLSVESFYRYIPESAGDQRKLIAVLTSLTL